MGASIQLAERVLTLAWRLHFRIPRTASWVVLGMGIIGMAFWQEVRRAEVLFVASVMVLLGVQGVVRWAYYRSASPALAIPFFEAASSGLAAEVRRVLVTSVRDQLVSPLDEAAVPIDVVVGPSDKRFAHRLRRQLGALYLVYGEIRDGEPYAVFSRLSLEPPAELMHQDWWTMDMTPQRTVWEAMFLKLSPSHGVRDIEYPLRSAAELSGLVGSLEGELWMLAGQPDRAENAFRQALNGLDNSESHAVDEIRVRLSHALRQQGKEQEALELLKVRASVDSASPELLRQFAALLMQMSDAANPYLSAIPASRDEGIAALRRAASFTSDPLRDQTLYNLAMSLGDSPAEHQEKKQLLEGLFNTKSHYRWAWYVKRERGLIHWNKGEALADAGEAVAARREFKLAAHWDSRALWARPKLRVGRRPFPIRVQGRVLWAPMIPRFKRYRIPPIMFGAANEAHDAAANRLRARYYGLRHRRRVNRLMKLGEKGLAHQEWDAAYANFDWVSRGRATVHSCLALVGRAIALQQLGRAELASDSLTRAQAMHPDGEQVAAVALQHFSKFQLPHGLPQGLQGK